MSTRSRGDQRSFASLALVVVLAGSAVAGCGSDAQRAFDPPRSPGDEATAHDGHVCPERLPPGDDPDPGFGQPAESAPSLPPVESAWVCQYHASDAGPGPDGDGTNFEWVGEGKARPVDPSRLPALERSLAELIPAEDDRMCTADLGPRWMLVYSSEDELIGVVVDDFGCRDVRLTDEPFETAPGEATGAGTVPGVLAAPADLLQQLKDAHSG